MPIRYVQTLGAVAGVVQVVNQVEITGLTAPAAVQITAATKSAVVRTATAKAQVAIAVTPTLTPDYGR